MAGLTESELTFFNASSALFQATHSVKGTAPGAPLPGLGPRFNMDSCAICHTQPAIGGSSSSVNPQAQRANVYGATNAIPFFVNLHGPVREARFKYNPDGTRDGNVQNLFTITGRYDAPGCNIAQPDFVAAAKANNLSLRIPLPLFGDGLVEAIPDSAILANKNADRDTKQALGISGHENRNPNDGTITRFGWKAQNKSMMIFAGEASNVEMGVTDEMFQNERDETPGCVFNGVPEDYTGYSEVAPTGVPAKMVMFATFIRMLAPPQPAPGPTTNAGRGMFEKIGCASCHTPSFTTAESSVAALSNQPVDLFSDLLVHKMGSGLADDIVQGLAGPDEFRTVPLWGVGQRIFFLHDGRTSDLLQAILLHASPANEMFPASEADQVIANFLALSPPNKQKILDFLRSL